MKRITLILSFVSLTACGVDTTVTVPEPVKTCQGPLASLEQLNGTLWDVSIPTARPDSVTAEFQIGDITPDSVKVRVSQGGLPYFKEALQLSYGDIRFFYQGQGDDKICAPAKSAKDYTYTMQFFADGTACGFLHIDIRTSCGDTGTLDYAVSAKLRNK